MVICIIEVQKMEIIDIGEHTGMYRYRGTKVRGTQEPGDMVLTPLEQNNVERVRTLTKQNM